MVQQLKLYSYLTIDMTVLLEYIDFTKCIHIMLGAYYFVNIMLNALLSSNLTVNFTHI